MPCEKYRPAGLSPAGRYFCYEVLKEERKKLRFRRIEAFLVGDERIELPQTESESAALPLCKSPIFGGFLFCLSAFRLPTRRIILTLGGIVKHYFEKIEKNFFMRNWAAKKGIGANIFPSRVSGIFCCRADYTESRTPSLRPLAGGGGQGGT